MDWQVTIHKPNTRKNELRQRMRECLRQCKLDPEKPLHALRASLEGLEQSRQIAIYCALPGEPDISCLISEMPQHHWLLPRVDGKRLRFHRVCDAATQLKPGAFGILEPDSSIPTTAYGDIDIFVCPGLAFDKHGGRLGRGRGFYDRVLAEARESALKIGLGFACQLVEDTHNEPHDIAMDAVLCHG